MAPVKKSTSPTRPPAWVTQIIADLQNLRHDIRRQELSIREIRVISLENQQFLRQHNATTGHNSSAHRPISRQSSHSRPQSTNNSSIADSSIGNQTSGSATKNSSRHTTAATQPKTRNVLEQRKILHSSTRASNQTKTEYVRQTATMIPRPSRPLQQAVSRICWYHRQFGQTSTHCIQPCEFVTPNPPLEIVHEIIQPANQQANQPQISSSVEPIVPQASEPDPVTLPADQPTAQPSRNWTESAAESPSSSSSSSSEDSDEPQNDGK